MAYARRKATTDLVIHYAATYPSMDIGAAEIDQWHKARGWKGIGYHFVVRRNGVVEIGRPEWAIGAHVAGHNAKSISICLVGGAAEGKPNVGEANFTAEQWVALAELVRDLNQKYSFVTIQGHRDYPGVRKQCPGFDVRKWLKREGVLAPVGEADDVIEATAEQDLQRYVYVSTALPNLWRIGMVFGISVGDIVAENARIDPTNLRDGDKVILPPL